MLLSSSPNFGAPYPCFVFVYMEAKERQKVPVLTRVHTAQTAGSAWGSDIGVMPISGHSEIHQSTKPWERGKLNNDSKVS